MISHPNTTEEFKIFLQKNYGGAELTLIHKKTVNKKEFSFQIKVYHFKIIQKYFSQ